MPKAVALTSALVETPAIMPPAAAAPRAPARAAAPKPKVKKEPLQLRLDPDEIMAIKVAAAQKRQNISKFMLACFHAYMESGKHD